MRYLFLNVKEIELWMDNPRGVDIHNNKLDERDIIKSFFNTKKKITQMKNLAQDIVLEGLLPIIQPCIWFDSENNRYISIDGNRRIVTLKLINDPFLIKEQEDLYTFYSELNTHYSNEEINVYLTEDYNEAIRIAEKIHLGEDEGRGQKNWNPKEKDFFKDKVKKVPKESITSSYLLRTTYPDFFEEIVERLKSSSVDRIIDHKIVKDTFEIVDYSLLNESQKENILTFLKLAEKFQNEKDIKISRFRTDHSELILNSMEKKTLESPKDIDITEIPKININLNPYTSTTSKTVRIMDLIDNKSEFTSIKIKSLDENVRFNEEKYIFLSENKIGNYSFQIKGFVNVDEVDSIIFNIHNGPEVSNRIILKSDEELTLKPVHGSYIDIPSMNNIISEINQLDFSKFSNIIPLGLRFITYESIKILFQNRSWHEVFTNLNDALIAIKKKLSETDIKNELTKKLRLENKSVASFVKSFDIQETYDTLNHLTHTSSTQTPQFKILDLSQTRLSTLLVYITALLK